MGTDDRRGAPLGDGEGIAAILVAQQELNLGPGKPGPGDEWRFGVEAPDVQRRQAAPEPQTERKGVLARLIRRR